MNIPTSTRIASTVYNTVQMFEPFQIGTKTEVLRLAPGPIWVQQSFLETSPSTFLRCASNETLVKAIALMVPELHFFKEKKQGKNCKIKCKFFTLHISESIWPPPFSTGVCRNEEPSPEGQRDKEISLYQFILSLFERVGQLLPGDFAGLLMSRPRLLAAGDSCCQKVPQRFSGSIQGVEGAALLANLWESLNTGGKIKFHKYMPLIYFPSFHLLH